MGPKGMRIGSEEDFTMRKFLVSTVHPIIRVIKPRILRWAVHVAEWKKIGMLSKF